MLNGHNGDVPPQPVLPAVEEPEIDVIWSAAILSGSGDFTPGGLQIFVQSPQYHLHSVTTTGTNAEAWEHLVALEQKVFTFGRQTEEKRRSCWPKFLSWKHKGGLQRRTIMLSTNSLALMVSSWQKLSEHWKAEWNRRLRSSKYQLACMRSRQRSTVWSMRRSIHARTWSSA